MKKYKIALGCDHMAVTMKDELVQILIKDGHQIIDCGTYNHERTHYPIYGREVGLQVMKQKADFGIVMCGTGVGISNAVNKVKGIRCMLTSDPLTAKLARQKWNANVIAIGARIVGLGLATEIIQTFLKTEYQNENHDLIAKINQKITHANFDEQLFDGIINNWYRGAYTEGSKQPPLILPMQKNN